MHVPLRIADRIGELAGGGVPDELHRDTQALAELAPKVGRDAARRAIGLVAQHQQEVGVVQADAQLARRCELLLGCGGDLRAQKRNPSFAP
jgi:hypothetical protein